MMMHQSVRVLLVEDSLAEADLIRSILRRSRRHTFEVTHAPRVATGLELLRGGAIFDVVLLDLNLPDSRGLEGFKRIREAVPHMPVVILTNDRDEEIAGKAVGQGAQDYLIKHEVDTELLARAIRYAVARQQAEQALRASEERYALAVAGARDGLWDWDIPGGRMHYSPRCRNMLSLGDGAELRLEDWLARIHPEDVDSFRSDLDAHLAGRSEHFEHEHRVVTEAGDYRWLLARGVAVRLPDGPPRRMAGSVSDVTRRKRAEEQLLHDTLHDALTRLPNRVLFMDRLAHALRRFRRDERRLFGVLFFDLDRFKTVNDSLGHSVGDELLVYIARRLEKFLRPGDTLARLGGDEFAILLNDIEDGVDATFVAERVQEQLSGEFTIRGHEVYTSASIGIALATSGYTRPEDMLRDADLAMYRAKSSGPARYAVFDSDMHESAVALHRLETDLRRALERDELVLHYQPIVSLANGRVLGFEALLRWQHPEWGLTYPDFFIRVAEENGLIVPISWWTLREASRRAREWQRLFPVDPPLAISVNISGKLFTNANMTDRLDELLAETGLPPACLRLEITECAVMDHGEAALAALARLRARGVQLHVDDFGTGYSSLTYLQRFAYDSLKIDRSFVDSMSRKDDSQAIVKAIVALGGMLGMSVIAEGVETPEQAERLRDLGCPEAQGYWYSRPLIADAVGDYLAGTNIARA